MLDKIIQFSLKNRLIVLAVAVMLTIWGSWTANNMDIDVFPDLTAPTVVVMTEAHGMAPEEVERLVSFPIETALNGATKVRRVRSSSAMGFSIVWIEFDWGMDIYRARQIVSERLPAVKEQLPKDVGNPTITPQSSVMGEVMIFSVSSDKVNPKDLRTLADWTIRPRLLSVSGVAQVTVIGGEYKEYQILFDPLKMKYYDVSLNDLKEATEQMNANASGGFYNQHGNEYIVRGKIRTKNVYELGQSVIKINDEYPIKISDVADIKIGAAPKIGDGSYRGKPAVVITVNKQPGTNTIKLTNKLDNAIEELKGSIGEDVNFHMDTFKQADFIDRAVDNVGKALLEGSIFVIIILFFFLMNGRTTIISLLAIPISLFITIICLEYLGFSINTMSLGGMAIAIGSLVDDAIIDVENVYKRLRQNVKLPKEERENSLKVIFDASSEIRTSIMNATFIIIIAFIPLFFLSGMEGRMLKPLGVSYIVALFSSLIVAITLTPVLCSLMLTNTKKLKKQENGTWMERNLLKVYTRSLERAMSHKTILLSISGVLLVVSIVILLNMGRSFLPPFNEGSLTVNVSSMPGISLEESNRVGARAEKILLSVPEVVATSRKTGRSELDEHSFGVNISEIEVPFNLKDRSRDEFLREVRSKLGKISGANIEVGQPISHRIDHMLSGTKANIAIKIFGDNLGELYSIASQVKGNISSIPGVVDPTVEQQIEIPQIQIKPKHEMLAKYGIPITGFKDFIDYGIAGEKVSEVFENEKSFELVLRLKDEHRESLDGIKDVLIDSRLSGKVPFSSVADIRSASGPNTINRENVQRRIVVSCNVADRDLLSTVSDIQKAIKDNVNLPENYHIVYGGQFESEARASKTLLITSLFAIIVIFLLLYLEFRSLKLASIILLNLPLALIGGVFMVWMYSGMISIPAIIGFITLFGIATRNGILLVSRYKKLREQGLNSIKAVILGSSDRLMPILMTALTAALALIPLAIAGDQPGNEIQSPMAVVILGGLLSSTLLNVYLIPIIYYLTSKTEDK
ncbi:MAG: efflux RND transporter permease subunit [Hyphomicrobiales bacterium]